jgi:hypothetical protein
MWVDIILKMESIVLMHYGFVYFDFTFMVVDMGKH